jgi:glycine cleavage system transcriptional repressor
MNKKFYYALTFFSEDKPGIVAKISKILFEMGINIEDSSSTLLRGFFSMILLVSTDERIEESLIARKFSNLKGITVTVKEVKELKKKKSEDTFVISVYGADKPGLVYSVSNLLAEHNVNIIDLQTKVAGKKDNPVYIMVFEVAVPENNSNSIWIDELKNISKEMGTDINIRQIETYEF